MRWSVTLDGSSLFEAGRQDHGGRFIWVMLKPRCVIKIGEVTAHTGCWTQLDVLDLSSRNKQHPEPRCDQFWRGSEGHQLLTSHTERSLSAVSLKFSFTQAVGKCWKTAARLKSTWTFLRLWVSPQCLLYIYINHSTNNRFTTWWKNLHLQPAHS